MGEYGTLRKRLRGTAAQGVVRAKTGSLNGVSSLTGFAQTADQTEAHFAMVFNELASTADGVRAGNAIAESIVAFPNAPELSGFSLPGQVPQAKPIRTSPPLDAGTPSTDTASSDTTNDVANAQPAIADTSLPNSGSVADPGVSAVPNSGISSSTSTNPSSSTSANPSSIANSSPSPDTAASAGN